MTITLERSFEEFVSEHGISSSWHHYQELKTLYNKVQKIRTFVHFFTRFPPIGIETQRLFMKSFQELSVPLIANTVGHEDGGKLDILAHLEQAGELELEILLKIQTMLESI